MHRMLNLSHLLQHEIDDLYSAEEQIIDALPKMIGMATSPELQKALNEHLKVTREQKKRLDRVHQLLNKEYKKEKEKNKSILERLFGSGTKCKGMEGLIAEGQKMMSEDMDPQVRDAAIIASCQKIEHYEISGYGTARAYANQLQHAEVERLLQTTLNEEYKADDLLTVLALQKVNLDAENAGDTAVEGNGRDAMRESSSSKAGIRKTASARGAAKKSAPKKKSPAKNTAKKKSNA